MVWEQVRRTLRARFSALQRAEIAEMRVRCPTRPVGVKVSVLFNEPKLLKCARAEALLYKALVSVLFNEPKLLKSASASMR